MRKLGTTLIGLLLLGCPPQLDDPDDPDDGIGTTADDEPALLGDELQGLGIDVVEDGPWVVRRSQNTGGAERSDGMEEFDGASLDSVSDSYAGAGAPVPMEMPAATARIEKKATRTSATAGQSASPMRAGSTDDNADFEEFLSFLSLWSDNAQVASQWDELDVSDRRVIRVADRRGNPAAGVQVSLVDEALDRVVWSGTTYGDGSLPYYPSVAARELGESAPLPTPKGGYLVQVRHGKEQTLLRWDGAGDELAVEIGDRQQVPDTIPLDVLFLIDTTGSMGDEIARIKATLLRVTERLKELEQEFDLHYAAVLYRDIGDDYVTKAHPFTGDIESFVSTLQGVQANGGGDGPESLNQGLAHAVSLDGWREGAARVMFLIADAPPHMDYSGDTPYGQSLLAAVDRGIRVHSVAASGLDSFGTVVMRQTAQFTGGKFIFVEYGSTAASAASHGVTGSVSSNNLDDIIYEQIAGELAGWGRPATALAAR
jgi:hypothetical protein